MRLADYLEAKRIIRTRRSQVLRDLAGWGTVSFPEFADRLQATVFSGLDPSAVLRALLSSRLAVRTVRGIHILAHTREDPDRYMENDHVSGFLRRTNQLDASGYFWNPGRVAFTPRPDGFKRGYFTVRDISDRAFVESRHDQILSLASLRIRIGRALESLVHEAVQNSVNRIAREFGISTRFRVLKNVSGNTLWYYIFNGPYFRFWANKLIHDEPDLLWYLYSGDPETKSRVLKEAVRRWVKKAIPGIVSNKEFKHDVDVLVVPETYDDPHWRWFRIGFECKNWSPTRSPDLFELWRYVNTMNLVGALPVFVTTALSPVVPDKDGTEFSSLAVVFRGKEYRMYTGAKKSTFYPGAHYMWCYKPLLPRPIEVNGMKITKSRMSSLAISGQLVIPYPMEDPLYRADWKSRGFEANMHVREWDARFVNHRFPRFAKRIRNPVLSRYPYLPLQSRMFIPEDIYFDHYDVFVDLGYYLGFNVETDEREYLKYLQPQIDYVLRYMFIKWEQDYITRWLR